MGNSRVLVLTVGTGDLRNLEGTLYAPLQKSIGSGDWGHVVLLPSLQSASNASELGRRLGGVKTRVRPLPEPGLEEDTDACFSWFDGVLNSLLDEGFTPEEITVDFTRGTKAMSAGLVLAAIRHEVARLRYVTGQRNDLGMVDPGGERIQDTLTTLVTSQKALDLAASLLKAGDFSAVREVLRVGRRPSAGRWPGTQSEAAEVLDALARFYGAWDRLDYGAAAAVTWDESTLRSGEWSYLAPDPGVRDWVRLLAGGPAGAEMPREMSAYLRRLLVDLLANGERRIRDGHFEDASIRGYRIVELVGQAALLDHDLDSSRLPPDHPAVQALSVRLRKKQARELTANPDGTLIAAREQVARLLKRLGLPLGGQLLSLAGKRYGEFKATDRNVSVWIHGFARVGPSEPEPLREFFADLADLLREYLGASFESGIVVARSLDLSARHRS